MSPGPPALCIVCFSAQGWHWRGARQDVVVAFAQQAHMSGAVVQDVCGGFLLCIAAATAAIRDVLPRPVSGCSCGEEV